jgi:hypothetical protein
LQKNGNHADVPGKAMNAPLRFESLLWMASPMAAWAQASAEPVPVAPKPAPTVRGTATKVRRKRGKSTA